MIGASGVSVVVPVRDGGATIRRAIDSVFIQTYAASEVIVVDDGSTDSTSRILESYGDRIRVVRQASRGPAAARNAGAAAASKLDYIAFLDADDVWRSDMLLTMVWQLSNHPSAVLGFCNVVSVNDDGDEIDLPLLDDSLAHGPSMDELLTRWWPILTSATVIRREAFDHCGGFNEAFKSPGYEDAFMWLVLREQGEFLYVPRRLVNYRITPPNQRMVRYSRNYSTFLRLVRERYGMKSARLIKNIRLGFVAIWGYQGLIALKTGDRITARRLFERALFYRPYDRRTVLRWARTFLPMKWSRALSGSFVNGVTVNNKAQEISSKSEHLEREEIDRMPLREARYHRPLLLKRPPNVDV